MAVAAAGRAALGQDTSVKDGSQALPQGMLSVGDEAQGQQDSGQVETEAVQQGTGCVGAQHSSKGA